jgi:hypothetical protein
VSDPQELGARAMQAMRAALAGSDTSTYSTQLPVTLIDKQSMGDDPTVAMLEKGST